MEDALAVDELDTSHNLSDEDLAFPLCQAVIVGGRSGDEWKIRVGSKVVKYYISKVVLWPNSIDTGGYFIAL